MTEVQIQNNRNYFGRYKILHTIGRGEFGKVKLAYDPKSDTKVAIKFIKRSNITTPQKQAKLEREINILQRLNHPNVVRLYDVIKTEKYIGMVMEYANGGELFDYISENQYLSEAESAKFFSQLLNGVKYLHSHHIVHRDLKLENLLLDQKGDIVITDFGFANNSRKNSTGLLSTSCGSPCYAAPELVINDNYIGEAADIWSCGIILYAMLCGYLPFDDDPNNPDGENLDLLYKYILESQLTFPEYVSEEAQELVCGMLIPDPEKRWNIDQVMSHKWLYNSLYGAKENNNTNNNEPCPMEYIYDNGYLDYLNEGKEYPLKDQEDGRVPVYPEEENEKTEIFENPMNKSMENIDSSMEKTEYNTNNEPEKMPRPQKEEQPSSTEQDTDVVEPMTEQDQTPLPDTVPTMTEENQIIPDSTIPNYDIPVDDEDQVIPDISKAMVMNEPMIPDDAMVCLKEEEEEEEAFLDSKSYMEDSHDSLMNENVNKSLNTTSPMNNDMDIDGKEEEEIEVEKKVSESLLENKDFIESEKSEAQVLTAMTSHESNQVVCEAENIKEIAVEQEDNDNNKSQAEEINKNKESESSNSTNDLVNKEEELPQISASTDALDEKDKLEKIIEQKIFEIQDEEKRISQIPETSLPTETSVPMEIEETKIEEKPLEKDEIQEEKDRKSDQNSVKLDEIKTENNKELIAASDDDEVKTQYFDTKEDENSLNLEEKEKVIEEEKEKIVTEEKEGEEEVVDEEKLKMLNKKSSKISKKEAKKEAKKENNLKKIKKDKKKNNKNTKKNKKSMKKKIKETKMFKVFFGCVMKN